MTTKTETQIPSIKNVLVAVRNDLKAVLERGLDLAEKRTKAVFRFARSVTKRIGARAGKK